MNKAMSDLDVRRTILIREICRILDKGIKFEWKKESDRTVLWMVFLDQSIECITFYAFKSTSYRVLVLNSKFGKNWEFKFPIKTDIETVAIEICGCFK